MYYYLQIGCVRGGPTTKTLSNAFKRFQTLSNSFKLFQTLSKLSKSNMFGQDSMWGDAGPMDSDGGKHDADWAPYYEQPSYNDTIGYYPDLEDSYASEYTYSGSFDEQTEEIDTFKWQTKIDKVHDELRQLIPLA